MFKNVIINDREQRVIEKHLKLRRIGMMSIIMIKHVIMIVMIMIMVMIMLMITIIIVVIIMSTIITTFTEDVTYLSPS